MKLTPRQEDSLDTSSHIAVTAGAGSGKTRILVERYITILKQEDDISPRNILALTFTDKAASEMKDRVRRSVRKLASEEGGRWFDILDGIDQADISTIHSFCTRIVRTLPVQAGVDPDFRIITETEASQMLQEVLNEVFTIDGSESPALRRLLVDYSMFQTINMLKSLLRESAKTKLKVGSEEFIERSLHVLQNSLEESLRKMEEDSSSLVHAINHIKDLSIPDVPKDSGVSMMRRMVPLFKNIGGDRRRLLNILDSNKELFLNKNGEEKKATRLGSLGTWKGDLGPIRDTFGELFSFVFEYKHFLPFTSGDDLSARARDRIKDLMVVYNKVQERFEQEKIKNNGLDFNDQISIAISLLKKNEEGILDSLRKRYSHLMVDEFQDTDPDQWDLVDLLWDGGNCSTLFIVGDPKQSIYGFRSADVRLFLEAQEGLNAHSSGRKVVLDRNFRSRREIMDFVNGTFPSIMEEENKWSVPFDPLEAHKGEGGSVTLVGVLNTYDSERREGEQAARLIKEAVGSWEVDDEGAERPIKYSDIAILVPTRKGFNLYEDGLRGEDIPFQVYKGKGFFERQEVSDVLNLLSFLSNPNDDLSLASLLKGPFFGISDEQLMRISMQSGGTLLDRLGTSPDHGIDHDKLEGYLQMARALPPHMALKAIMEDSMVYACVGGKRETRNLDRVFEWAMTESSVSSMAELRERLKRLVDEPPKEGEPPLSLDDDSVTMMTIHSAKGLEWPMVLVLGMNHEGGGSYKPPYLLDPDNGISLKVIDHRTGELIKPPSMIMAEEDARAKELQERKRLLYVACTRAMDHLVMSGAIPIRKDGVELEPHGMFKLMWNSLDLSIQELDEGVKLVNEVPVRLIVVRPEDITSEEEHGMEDAMNLSTEGGAASFSYLGEPASETWTFLTSPSRILENDDPRGIPSGPVDDPGLIPPDEFGDMVHAVLQGIPIERVIMEKGWADHRRTIQAAVDEINDQLNEMDIEEIYHEVEVVSGNFQGIHVLGRMDLLVKLKDGSFRIIDFKTGQKKDKHATQLEIYRDMSSDLLTGDVSTSVIYSKGPRP